MPKIDIKKTIYKNSSGKYYAILQCVSHIDENGLQKSFNIFGHKVMINPDGKTEIQYFTILETRTFRTREKLEKRILKVLKKAKDYVDSQLIAIISKENIIL